MESSLSEESISHCDLDESCKEVVVSFKENIQIILNVEQKILGYSYAEYR